MPKMVLRINDANDILDEKDCPICNFIKDKEVKKYFIDKEIVIISDPNKMDFDERLCAFPRQHTTDLSSVQADKITNKLFEIASEVFSDFGQDIDMWYTPTHFHMQAQGVVKNKIEESKKTAEATGGR